MEKDWKEDIKMQWAKLTQGDVDMIGKDRARLVKVLQQRYGWSKEQAEQELEKWSLDRPTPFS